MKTTKSTIAGRGVQTHHWNKHECSCGSDTVICQGCGRAVCGTICVYDTVLGNIEPSCLAKFGLGHAGTSAAEQQWCAELQGKTTMGFSSCPQ